MVAVGADSRLCRRPRSEECLFLQIVVSACGGQAHSVALTNKGKLFTFGCNTYGQLGIGSQTKSTLPVKVLGIRESISMVATQFFHNVGPNARRKTLRRRIAGTNLPTVLPISAGAVRLESVVYVGLQSARTEIAVAVAETGQNDAGECGKERRSGCRGCGK